MVKMPEQMSLFHSEPDRPNFEELGRINGGKFWYARDFMVMLGYESFQAFGKAINKAIATCTALNISVVDNFKQVRRSVNGEVVDDFKLTRFACYLTSINGDVRKREVAEAQAYFVTMAEAFRRYIQNADDVERVQIREDVSDREKSLSQAAHAGCVVRFDYFQNQGYLGLYNMNLTDLKLRKGVPSNRSPLDFMGREELAANLFRITQTEAKIRTDALQGQRALEAAALSVGKKVRKTIIDISGIAPEALPASEDIQIVKGNLKKASKEFGRLDKKKPKQLGTPTPSPVFVPDDE